MMIHAVDYHDNIYVAIPCRLPPTIAALYTEKTKTTAKKICQPLQEKIQPRGYIKFCLYYHILTVIILILKRRLSCVSDTGTAA